MPFKGRKNHYELWGWKFIQLFICVSVHQAVWITCEVLNGESSNQPSSWESLLLAWVPVCLPDSCANNKTCYTTKQLEMATFVQVLFCLCILWKQLLSSEKFLWWYSIWKTFQTTESSWKQSTVKSTTAKWLSFNIARILVTVYYTSTSSLSVLSLWAEVKAVLILACHISMFKGYNRDFTFFTVCCRLLGDGLTFILVPWCVQVLSELLISRSW